LLNARKFARFVVKRDILINGSIKGKALDISESGMLIHSHIPFPTGSEITLEFSLRDADPLMRIKAVVQHVKMGVGIGIRFHDLPEASLARIRTFVSNFCDKLTEHRKKVLLVEDSPAIRMMYKGCIEMMECEVREAADGNEALEKIAESRPDLILLDLYMDGMDGFQFLEVIRSDESLKDLKVVVLTSAVGPDVKDRLAPFEILDFLTKMMTTPRRFAEKLSSYLS